AWGKPYFSTVVKMVKSEVVFLLYLMLLVCSVFTLNMDIVGVALLPLLVFIVLKTIKNRSLVNGLYSAMNMTIRAAGLLKGLMQPMRDPIVPPGNKIIHR
ncbi:TPA: glycosyl transferase, partial [Escherichia coli]|nr:glycosyl transferase [Escherichia coli]